MKDKTLIIFALIGGGLALIVYTVNKQNTPTPGVTGLSGAAGYAVGNAAGNSVFGALQGAGASLGQGLSDIYSQDFPDETIQLNNSSDQAAADAYVAGMGGYVAPGLP